MNLSLGSQAAPKAEIDVRAPKAEVRGPKVDVGAKVGGFLEGVGADIGGLFKAPKAEVNVQAPKVDVQAPKLETGGSVSLSARAPALDVSASAPKPQVQLGSPQVNLQGPQLVCLMQIFA